MTEKAKVYVERWLFVWIIGAIFFCLIALQVRKAENARIELMQKEQDRQCQKLEKTEEAIIRIDNNIIEMKTMLKERLK